MSLNVKIVGVQGAIAALRDVPRGLQRKHMRIALSKGGGILKAAAQPFVPVESGLLKRSLAVKVGPPGRPARYAEIGPKRRAGKIIRRNSRGMFKTSAAGTKKFLGEVRVQRDLGARGSDIRRGALHITRASFSGSTYRNPARYAHLVEKGFHHKSGRSVRPRSFLSTAVRMSGPAAQQAVVQKLREGLTAEARIAFAKYRR